MYYKFANFESTTFQNNAAKFTTNTLLDKKKYVRLTGAIEYSTVKHTYILEAQRKN